MKLLYYVGTGSNKFGGLEKFNISLLKRLKGKNIDTIVVYKRPIAVNLFKDFLKKEDIKTYTIFDTFDVEHGSKIDCARKLGYIVRKERPNVIHYNFGNPHDMMMVRVMNPFLRFKPIYTSHCHPSLKSTYMKGVFFIVSMLSKKILCVSDAIRREFVDYLHSHKASTLYLGVPKNLESREQAREKLGFKDDEVIICNIAYHDPVKGIDVLIHAIEYLYNELGVRNFRLIQIGGQPFKKASEYIQALLSSANISKCFEMWGLRNDIETIMCGSDIYCQSSRSEGIPLSIMEAGMASLPIVATNVGGVSEVARDGNNALLSQSEDYKALAKNLKTLIDSKSERLRMGNNGLKIASDEFDVEVQVEKLVAIYEAI